MLGPVPQTPIVWSAAAEKDAITIPEDVYAVVFQAIDGDIKLRREAGSADEFTIQSGAHIEIKSRDIQKRTFYFYSATVGATLESIYFYGLGA